MNIKLFVMDVDGTLTDGKIYMGQQGEFFKAFDIKDGYGIYNILPLKSIIPIILTNRKSQIVENRAKELGIIDIYQGVEKKSNKLQEICSEKNCSLSETAYIGDDLNDLDCMRLCGVVGCPAGAVSQVKEIADYISTKNGGEGAVREFIEWMVNELER